MWGTWTSGAIVLPGGTPHRQFIPYMISTGSSNLFYMNIKSFQPMIHIILFNTSLDLSQFIYITY